MNVNVKKDALGRPGKSDTCLAQRLVTFSEDFRLGRRTPNEKVQISSSLLASSQALLEALRELARRSLLAGYQFTHLLTTERINSTPVKKVYVELDSKSREEN